MITYSVIIQIAAIISMLSSLSVILTLSFRGLRQKLFMQIIAIISLCDLIANAPYVSVQRYPNDSAMCVVQGFINIYFYPVSWLWTTALMSLLFSLATTGKLPLSYPRLHSICWIFPMILAVLNFATVSKAHAAARGRFSFEICSLGDPSFTSELYHMITYYGLLVTCFIIMLTMYVKILFTENKYAMWDAARNTLILYPLALFVCWTPHVAAVILIDYSYAPDEAAFYLASDCLKVLHGTVTAVIFFYKSGEARSRWAKLFFKLFNVLRVSVGLVPLSEEAAGAIVTDFSVEYDDSPLRESAVEAHPYTSDEKQGDVSAVHMWGGFGLGSSTGSRSNSRSSSRNDSVASQSGGGRGVLGNGVLSTTQSRMHSKGGGGEMRDSLVEMQHH